MNLGTIVDEVLKELERAETMHPIFPADTIHQVAIMAEESGEAVRAALQAVYENGDLADVEKEVIQTAAMCFRVLKNLYL